MPGPITGRHCMPLALAWSMSYPRTIAASRQLRVRRNVELGVGRSAEPAAAGGCILFVIGRPTMEEKGEGSLELALSSGWPINFSCLCV